MSDGQEECRTKTQDECQLPGLYMLWEGDLNAIQKPITFSREYSLRCYEEGDEELLKELWAVADWTWDEEHWEEYRNIILPEGLFLVFSNDENLVATAGAVHNPLARYYFPFGGELGNLLVHPEHRQRGLGVNLSIRVVQRLLSAGYASIRVCAQGFRLAAIKTYLSAGFMPFVHQDDVLPRWKSICEQIGVPYHPDNWPSA